MQGQTNCGLCRIDLTSKINRDARHASRYLEQLEQYQEQRQLVRAKQSALARLFKVGLPSKPKPPKPSYRMTRIKNQDVTLCEECFLHSCVEGLTKPELQQFQDPDASDEEDTSSERDLAVLQ
jgi:hypothetical protein